MDQASGFDMFGVNLTSVRDHSFSEWIKITEQICFVAALIMLLRLYYLKHHLHSTQHNRASCRDRMTECPVIGQNIRTIQRSVYTLKEKWNRSPVQSWLRPPGLTVWVRGRFPTSFPGWDENWTCFWGFCGYGCFHPYTLIPLMFLLARWRDEALLWFSVKVDLERDSTDLHRPQSCSALRAAIKSCEENLQEVLKEKKKMEVMLPWGELYCPWSSVKKCARNYPKMESVKRTSRCEQRTDNRRCLPSSVVTWIYFWPSASKLWAVVFRWSVVIWSVHAGGHVFSLNSNVSFN